MGILRTDKISGLETPTAVTGSVNFDGSRRLFNSTSSELLHGEKMIILLKDGFTRLLYPQHRTVKSI